MSKKMKVYIAGPYGFSEAGREFYYNRVVPMIEGSGCEVIDPWRCMPQDILTRVQVMPYGAKKRDAWTQLNMEIGENNERALNESDGVLAILDGPDVDSGTAAEIGYAYGKGKRILGYRGDFRLSADNEGGIVNIQVEYFIRKSGGTIITKIEDLPSALKRILLEH